MLKKRQLAVIAAASLSLAAFPGIASEQPIGSITIDTANPGIQVSPTLYGAFFEDINRAGDGGIYAEMIQNRSFEDNNGFAIAWFARSVALSLDRDKPINPNNPTALKVISEADGMVWNAGFIGNVQGTRARATRPDWQKRQENAPGQIFVEKGKKYDFSVFARAENTLPLTVSLITTAYDGEKASAKNPMGKVLATAKIKVGTDWKKHTLELTPNDTASDAYLVISSGEKATYYLDMVSLFPRDTWKGRPNGLRADLMEHIAAMKPAFIRFPGGCYVEGELKDDRAVWKDTIGPVEERKGQWNFWQYLVSNGLGYHEGLQMCEDLGAEPLFVINCGMGHKYNIPLEEMGPFVQDALDAIEYANGPVDSKWGALRAKHGHPAPFKLKYIEIGNENGGKPYQERYPLFAEAIKAKYPEMRIIATQNTPNYKNDMVDDHMFSGPGRFRSDANRFDKTDRKGPQIYFGEYAVTSEAGLGNLRGALAEAAFMTGMERNSDVVIMSSYAPLMRRVGWEAWNPNAIVFDQSRSYGTPSYWVQRIFSLNRADRNLNVNVDIKPQEPGKLRGGVGLTTWGTNVEFKDFKVEKDGKVIFSPDFQKDLGGFRVISATGGRLIPPSEWKVGNGVLTSTREKPAIVVAGEPDWSNYTVSVKARKLRGPDGFGITFARDAEERSGGVGFGNRSNTHGLNHPNISVKNVRGKVETDRWYEVKIEVSDDNVKCYFEGEKVFDTNTVPEKNTVAAVAGLDRKTGEKILKFVNVRTEAVCLSVKTGGGASGAARGKAITLTSASQNDENSFAEPVKIAPKESTFEAANGQDFNYTFPANSVTILRWK